MNNIGGLILVAWLLLSLAAPAQKNARPAYQVQQVPNGKIYIITQTDPTYTFDSARYTIFIPDSMPSLNGVFVHQHGCTMEGTGAATAYDLQYQAFAKKWHLAVVGPDLYAAKGNCHNWRNGESGSGKALIKTLEAVGEITGYRRLAVLPWLLWGHSGGGYWALSMLRTYPERILAVFGYSPAFDPGAYPPEAFKVPVMMRHAGPEGDACCWQTSIKAFDRLRSGGGYVSIAYTPYQHHNYSYVRYMAIPFYEAILQQRLPEKPGAGYTAMRPVDKAKAWLADTLRYNLFPSTTFTGNPLNAAWLPDSITAVKWREYVITGTVTDRTPPPAPYGLQITGQPDGRVVLTWKADADVESGISHFNIYRNHVLVGRLPSTGTYQQFDTNGDNAYPLAVPKMEQVLAAPVSEMGTIAVSTVNLFGLESARISASR
ncbi:MAG: alpha/beta hydrolase [Niabella sp.]|nr:alpha/beta hydrolase [Niabella sp.]